MIIDFLGHLHPVFVHLPIGFLALAYVIQYLFKSNTEKSRLIDFVLVAGILSSLLAALLGWMLSLSGGYEENLLDWHRYTAIAVCVVSIALLAYKKYKKEDYKTPYYHAGFHLMMLALLLAGHFGGEMTHGEGYLLEASTDLVSKGKAVGQHQRMPKPTASSTASDHDDITEPSGPAALDTIAPADAASIAALKKINVAVVPLATGTHFLELNMVNAPSFGDKDVPLLQQIAPQVMWLVLADTKITDAGLEPLKSCSNTTRLNLKNTAITNASIPWIAQFSKLEYLNIVGTKIDDAGLLGLAPSATLKKIFCWQSGITANGVMAFQKKYPNIDIDFGEKK